MVYKLPQTYPFACPQAKQRVIFMKNVWKRKGFTQFKNSLSSHLQYWKPHQISPKFSGILYTISKLSNQIHLTSNLANTVWLTPSTDLIFYIYKKCRFYLGSINQKTHGFLLKQVFKHISSLILSISSIFLSSLNLNSNEQWCWYSPSYSSSFRVFSLIFLFLFLENVGE